MIDSLSSLVNCLNSATIGQQCVERRSVRREVRNGFVNLIMCCSNSILMYNVACFGCETGAGGHQRV